MRAFGARAWWPIAIAAAALAAAFVAARTLDAAALVQEALAFVARLGPWGPALFVLLYLVATVLLLPAVVLTLGAGAVFGLGPAVLAVSAGATLGATASFLIGRHLARGWVAGRLAAHPTLRAIDEAVGREGWKLVLLTRLSPAFPFVLLNYAFGLTRVSLRDYVVASWIGMTPGIVLYAYVGSLAADVAAAAAGGRARSPWEWALYGLGLVATLLVAVYVARLARAALERRLAR